MGTASLGVRFPTSSTVAQVMQTVVSVSLVAENAQRKGLNVVNESSSALFVKLGSGVSSTDFSVKLPARANYELPFPGYTGVVTGVWAAAGGGFASVTELI